MSRRRRHALLALVLGLIGLALNIAIAWICVLLVQPVYFGPPWHADLLGTFVIRYEGEAKWPLPVPDHWPAMPTDAGSFQRRRGVETLRFDGPHSARVSLSLNRAGWPMRSLRWEEWRENQAECTGIPFWRRGLPVPQTPVPLGWRFRSLPLMPVWPGFIVNTFIFALAGAALWHGPALPGHLRKWNRRRRGSCIWCNYSRAGLAKNAVCPECGKC